jgi:hypothetical protein
MATTLPPWVFSSETGTPLDLFNVTKGWRRILKHAKLPASVSTTSATPWTTPARRRVVTNW